MNMFEKHSRYIRFTILLIPLFLVFMGIKVPNLLKPHTPKPMRRAVLDKTPVNTVLKSIVKADIDFLCISGPTALVVPVRDDYSVPDVHHVLPVLFLSPSPFPPRAPPISTALA